MITVWLVFSTHCQVTPFKWPHQVLGFLSPENCQVILVCGYGNYLNKRRFSQVRTFKKMCWFSDSCLDRGWVTRGNWEMRRDRGRVVLQFSFARPSAPGAMPGAQCVELWTAVLPCAVMCDAFVACPSVQRALPGGTSSTSVVWHHQNRRPNVCGGEVGTRIPPAHQMFSVGAICPVWTSSWDPLVSGGPL